MVLDMCTLPFAGMQAPLLAYNHFVESLFVLNDCRAGLHGGGSAAMLSDMDGADASDTTLAQLKGKSASARLKREAIYRCSASCLCYCAHHCFCWTAKNMRSSTLGS